MRFKTRLLILLADAVEGIHPVVVSSSSLPERIAPGMSRLHGVGHDAAGLIYIFDPEKLLLPEEESQVDRALQG